MIPASQFQRPARRWADAAERKRLRCPQGLRSAPRKVAAKAAGAAPLHDTTREGLVP